VRSEWSSRVQVKWNWILVLENVVREKRVNERKEKDEGKGNHSQPPPG